MNQNKKILLMVAGIGLLLVGFLLFMFSRKDGNEAPPVANDPSSTTMPAPTGSAPPAPGMPAPTDPGSMNAGMTPTVQPVQPVQPAQPQVLDPFSGGPGRVYPPKKVKIPENDNIDSRPDEPDMIPVYQIPNVNTDGGAIRWDNRGAVDSRLRDASVSFGRAAGWIANDTRGRVVAYFETPDGGVRTITVDSVYEGYRVKAINVDEQYLLLVNLKSGQEEKMTMQGARRAQ